MWFLRFYPLFDEFSSPGCLCHPPGASPMVSYIYFFAYGIYAYCVWVYTAYGGSHLASRRLLFTQQMSLQDVTMSRTIDDGQIVICSTLFTNKVRTVLNVSYEFCNWNLHFSLLHLIPVHECLISRIRLNCTRIHLTSQSLKWRVFLLQAQRLKFTRNWPKWEFFR